MRAPRFFIGDRPIDRSLVQSEFVNRKWKLYAVENGVQFPVRQIDFKVYGSRHECGPKCQNATRSTCECSCLGANHGRGNK